MDESNQQLKAGMFSNRAEKTIIDKLLARKDVEALRELMKKEPLTREDLLEILYLLGSSEAKLLNLGEWDRYILLKYYVWVREFVKIAELNFDYKDDLEKKESTCQLCEKRIRSKIKNPLLRPAGTCECKTPRPHYVMSARTRQTFHNVQRLIEHNVKFLVDLYLNIGRTTLSIGGTGLMEFLKNKFEMAYSGLNPGAATPAVPMPSVRGGRT